MTEPGYSAINTLVLCELAQRKYVRASSQPVCVHALEAIRKASGSFRPITDCRRPEGQSINNFMDETHQTFAYSTIDYVCSFLHHSCYMCTVDISSAYCSIYVSPMHWKFHSIQWVIDGVNQFLWDTRLSFGLKCAPFIFTQVSNFVVRCMHRRGITGMVSYLDDFILFGSSFEQCQGFQMTLIDLLGSLGFNVAWEKWTTLSNQTRYLGVNFDSIKLELKLPDEKLKALKQELHQLFWN